MATQDWIAKNGNLEAQTTAGVFTLSTGTFEGTKAVFLGRKTQDGGRINVRMARFGKAELYPTEWAARAACKKALKQILEAQ